MRALTNIGAVLVFPLVIAGCSSPPTAEVETARAAVHQATESAQQYAKESLAEAQTAQAALEAELKIQEGKWFKSYDRAQDLAVETKAAAELAIAEATTVKARADAGAAKARSAAARAKVARTPLRVINARVRPPMKVRDVAPVYPAIAKSARVDGTVVIEATIDETGKVSEARVVKSVPLLDEAALDAVRQWEYAPALMKREPVPVVMTVNVNFTRP